MMLVYMVAVAGIERFESDGYGRARAVCARPYALWQPVRMSVSVIETIDDSCEWDCCDTSEEYYSCGYSAAAVAVASCA
jgi:hypothetical protein